MIKKSGINELKAGTVLSYVQMAVSIIINIAYTPVMLRLLGQSEYGLYNTVASTISLLSILNLGFNAGYIRYFAKYKKENDEESIFKLNGLFIVVFTIIGIIALLCGIFLIFNIEMVFKTGLTQAEYATARVLMALLTINLSVSFPMSVFASIISANERFIFLKSLSVIRTVLGPLVTLPLLLAGYRSIAMVSVTVVISFMVDAVYLWFVKYRLNNRFYFHDFESGLLRSLFVYTSFIAINTVIDQINWNIDKILLGRYKGTISVAIYSVGYTLYQCYQMLSTSISGVFTPRIHRIVNQESSDKQSMNRRFTELFIKVGRVQFLVLALAASGMVIFGKRFIYFWAGDGYADSYYVALLLTIPASIALIQNLGIEIQRAENKHQFRSICYAVMAGLNLILSVFLCQLYGPIGSAIGTAISLIVANGIIMNIYYYKTIGLDIPLFWKNILRQSVGLIIPVICGIVINRVTVNDSILIMMGEIVAYTIIYAISMWFLGTNDYEKDIVRKFITPIVNRGGKHD